MRSSGFGNTEFGNTPCSRHRLVRCLVSCLATCFVSVLLVVLGSAANPANAVDRLELEVRETSGLARRGYPAHILLKLPRPLPLTTNFRLIYEGKPVVAQFRPDGDEATAKWWLDFQTEMKPEETKKYVIEFGDDVPSGPERTGGHKLTRIDGDFSIANAPYITWTVPHDLKGLLKSVDFAPAEFLRADSPGLMLRDRQSRERRFSGTGRVLRQGPMAVGLRFEAENREQSQEPLPKVRSTVDLTFPAPVSWVEVDWNLDDPLNNVGAVGLQLHLNLEKADSAPTLVEFGTTSVVYTSLRVGQDAEFLAGPIVKKNGSNNTPIWEIFRGDKGQSAPFALGPKPSTGNRVEGWTHVMDSKICLALAVADFARDTRDRIHAAAGGSVTVWREYDEAAEAKQKRLHMWLHFVHFPPQATAAASPQQMQTPLEVRQLGP